MDTMNGETYLKDMIEWNDEDPDLETLIEQSEIANFFSGCNVFITGASGFIGKLLVDKLLRSCPKVNKLYLLMRAKKGKTSEERFKEHFEDPLFERLKREKPNFMDTIVMIEGQMDADDLGLSLEHRQLVMGSHVIFHGAATVRFDEPLRTAVNINVRGTKEMLLLAKKMPNLKAFVHIGTAFSQCVTKLIDEVFYDPPFDSDKLLSLIEILDDEQLKILTPSLIGSWPNTYAFTKALAEDIVKKYSTGIPTCIVRPSIMIATAYEPITGWINNLYGPTGVVVGAGIGLLRTLHCKKNNVADIIPADYVINNIIAAAWGIEHTRTPETEKPAIQLTEQKEEFTEEIEDPLIYNSVSSCQRPVTWGEFMKWNEIYGMQSPSSMMIWYYSFCLNRHLWIHNLYVILFHMIPAAIVDSLAWITGRKPMLWTAYRKIHKFSGVIAYFSTQQWTFRNEMVMKLWNQLNPADRKLFYFDMTDLVWSDYFLYHSRGLRVYLLKDNMDTLPQGLVKLQRFKIAHYSLMTISWLLLMWLGLVILRSIFSIFW